jgi:hypothetical protein
MADRTLRIDIDVNERGAVAALRSVDLALDHTGAAAKAVNPYLERMNALVQQFSWQGAAREAAAYTRAIQQVGGVSKLSAVQQIDANRVMSEAIASGARYGRVVPQAFLDAKKATDEAVKGVKGLGDQTQRTTGFTSGLTSMIMRFAGPLAIGMAIRRTLDWADSIEEMSQATGIGTERLQQLRYAADQGGLGFDRMIQGVGQLQDRIAGGDKSAVAALGKFGLEAKAFAALNTDEEIIALANGIGKVEDAATRTQALKDLFGRAGMYWAPVLADLNKKMAEAPVLAEANVRALAALNDMWARMKDTGLVLVATVLVPMASLMRDMSKGEVSAGTAGFWGTFFKLAPSIGPSAAWTQAQVVSDLMAKAAGIPPPRNADILLGKEGATPAQRAAIEAIDKLADDLWGDTAIAHARAMIAAMESRGRFEDLAIKKQEMLRKALEEAAEMAGTRFPRELRKFQESLVLASSAIQMSQLTKAPISVEGWPGLTEWAGAQAGLEGRDLSGVQWGLPSGTTGNMQGGRLTTTTAEVPAWVDSLNTALTQLPQNLLGAAMGGGDYWKTISATFAQQGAKQLEPMFEGIFGKDGAKLGDWQISNQALAGAANAGLTMLGQYASTQTGPGWGALSGSIQGAQSGGWQGAIAGYFIGAVTGAYDEAKAKWEDVKTRRGAYEAAHGGLEKLNQQAAAVGLTLEKFYNPQKTGDLAAAIAELDAAFAKLDTSVKTLARISSEGGLLKKEVVADLVRAAHYLPEVRQALQEFYVSETQRGIKGLGQWTAGLTALTAASAPGATGAALAYWEGLEAQGLSLVEILDTLGPQIATIQEALAAAGVSGGAAFEAIARIATATADPAVRTVLEAVTGINTVLETLFNTGQLTQEIFGGLIAGVTEQYDELMRLGKGPEEARRLVRQPLQTIWQLQQTYKFTVDEGTQRLLADALAAGEVGEAFKPAADRMTAAIDKLIAALETFTGAILGQAPGVSGGGIDTGVIGVREGLPTGGREVGDWDVGHWGGWVTPQGIKRWHDGGQLSAAHAGATLWPAGQALVRAHEGLKLASDEVPAILQTGERVLSRDETQALGVWAEEILGSARALAQVVLPKASLTREQPLPVGMPVAYEPLLPALPPLAATAIQALDLPRARSRETGAGRPMGGGGVTPRADRPMPPIHITVESRLDGRKVARNQIRLLPDALGRYGEA